MKKKKKIGLQVSMQLDPLCGEVQISIALVPCQRKVGNRLDLWRGEKGSTFM